MRELSSAIKSLAKCTDFAKADRLRITWSVGMTNMTASGSDAANTAAAKPMQGAVSRRHGSPITETPGN
jgi:hypothetical protein